MRTNRIEKRLNAIEQSQKEPVKLILSWSKPENSLAYMAVNAGYILKGLIGHFE